jgi:integrase
VKQPLNDAIEDYIGHLESKGRSKAYLKASRICLRRLLTLTGNILTENIHEAHVDLYFREASKTRSARSLGLDTSILKGFFKWAVRTRRAGRSGDPMADRTRPRAVPREWRGFPVSKVPALLDSAQHPRDRMLLALGCFLLGRSIEFTILTVGHVDLDSGYINYKITKTGKRDMLPICEELDEELRRWLKVYTEECGPLDPNWYLVPAKTPPKMNGDRQMDQSTVRLAPTRKLLEPYVVAHSALSAIGFPLRDADGRRLNEGMHTIRRSMARGLYEQLRDEGDVNPVETVRSMLNHATEKQTRDYIGLQSERIHRDSRLRGKAMFPGLRGENVRVLGPVRMAEGM